MNSAFIWQLMFKKFCKPANRVLFAGLMIFLLQASCRERENGVGISSRKPDSSEKVSNRNRKSEVSLVRPDKILAVSNLALANMGEQDLYQFCVSIINSKSLKPESQNADNLEDGIYLLLAKNNPLAYEVIDSLPPGYYSGAIVGQVFSRFSFKSMDEVLKRASPIKQPDMFTAAINSGATFLPDKIRRGETSLGMDIAALKQLQSSGLSEQNFTSLVVAGTASGELATTDIISNINPKSNLMLVEAVSVLPPEVSTKMIEEAIAKKSPIDLGSIGVLAVKLVRKDPVEAMTWATGLPNREENKAIRSAVTEWLAADSLAASTYVDTMAEGKNKDISIGVIVDDCIKNGNFEDADKWADSISDTESKNNAIRNIDVSKSKIKK